jgi:exopolyphosphatase/guanosine-5'-triphosphate,3'-diphosphate pyrophosphatase
MRLAAVDIGTNSVKYLLAEADGEKGGIVLKDAVKITKLGEGLRGSGLISSSAIQRTAYAVKEFVADAKKNGADAVRIVGTMALRTASNACELSDKLRELTGIETEVLSGEEEALLSFSGAVSGFDLSNVNRYCTIDTGGGSTELVFAEKGEIVCKASLKTGALLLTEKFFSNDTILEEDLEKAGYELKQVFDSVKPPFKVDMAVGIGGNVTSMASVYKRMEEYDPEEAHGTVLPEEEVERQIGEYSVKSPEERRKIPGLDPERADIILAGACIIRYAMRFAGCTEIVVSDRGLRHGILFSMLRG